MMKNQHSHVRQESLDDAAICVHPNALLSASETPAVDGDGRMVFMQDDFKLILPNSINLYAVMLDDSDILSHAESLEEEQDKFVAIVVGIVWLSILVVVVFPRPRKRNDKRLEGGISTMSQFIIPIKDAATSSATSLVKVSSAASLAAASLTGLTSVSSSGSLARLSAAVHKMSIRPCFKQQDGELPAHVPTLSATELFVGADLIGQLTLKDISTIIQYCIESSRFDFDDASFFANLNPILKEVLAAVDAGVCASRGVDTFPSSQQGGDGEAGDFDALLFCAALRIFAEWRLLRQVPEGYKSYAIGMKLGHKDLVQNISKIETGVHEWIEVQRRAGIEDVASPTFRQLLDYEVTNKMHPRLPRVADKTAAIGVLWMKRQMLYQTLVLANFLQVPFKFSKADEAVSAAYKEVYHPYHGWVIQKTFQYSFKGAPPAEDIFRVMNPGHLKELMETVDNFVPQEADSSTEQDLPGLLHSSYASSSFDDESSNGTGDFHDAASDTQQDELQCQVSKEEGTVLHIQLGKEWDKFCSHVHGEWNNFLGQFDPSKRKEKEEREQSSPVPATVEVIPPVQDALVMEDKNESLTSQKVVPQELPRRAISAPTLVLTGEELDKYVAKEMTKNAHNEIEIYLAVMQPILSNLSRLIEEFNMNDPTKV